MQQIYRTPMPKCDFNKIASQLRHGRSPKVAEGQQTVRVLSLQKLRILRALTFI